MPLIYQQMLADTTPEDPSHTHLEGESAVVFGSFQQGPAVGFLSPLVLKKVLKTDFLGAFSGG